MEVREGYKKTEVGIIPEDWEVKLLGEIGVFKNGINKSNEDFGFGSPFANLMDVFGKSSIYKNEDFGLINSNQVEKKLYDLIEGDVLFIRSSIKPSGIGLTCVIERTLFETVFSGFIIRFRDKGCLVKSYKRHCFYDELFRNRLIGASTVSANTNINQEALKRLLLGIPTISEQIAIATTLSDTDSLINSLEKLIAKKRNIKQGAMQKLLQPKEGWEVKTYGEIFTFLTTATYSRAELCEGEDISYIHYGDIHTKWDSFLDFEKSNLPTILDELSKNYPLIKNGDIIMADASEDYKGIGKSVEVKNIETTKAISGLHTFLLRDEGKVFVNGFRGYLHLISSVKSQFDKLATGLKVYGVSKSNLKTVKLPVPSHKEQTHIATILSDMDAEITALQSKLEKYKKIKAGMMQQLLTGKIRLV